MNEIDGHLDKLYGGHVKTDILNEGQMDILICRQMDNNVEKCLRIRNNF